jgi:hypothetical protein
MTNMATDLEVVSVAQASRWLAVLAEIPEHDFYHLPGYHEMAEREGDGEARLLVYREAGHTIALPLMIRRCDTIAGLEGVASVDATSVYGYAGPVSSYPRPPQDVILGFQAGLRRTLESIGAVTLFTRLHPLFDQATLIDGLGETLAVGSTVSIDLTLSEADQLAQYRTNHVRDIRKLLAMGATCLPGTSNLDEFGPLYNDAMARLGASSDYYFGDEYFALLGRELGSQVQLFSCVLDGQVVAAGLFLKCGDIVQYHLGAARNGYENVGAMKLVIETARRWANGADMRVLHLGGGRGGRADSLFHFKAGFSHRRHQYSTWRWVVDEQANIALNERKKDWNAGHAESVTSPEYFPRYRSPTRPIPPAPPR